MTTLDDWLARHAATLVAIRRDLHAHLELGFEEAYTAGVVARTLREWGVEVTEGVAGTGVVGIIRGRRPRQIVECEEVSMISTSSAVRSVSPCRANLDKLSRLISTLASQRLSLRTVERPLKSDQSKFSIPSPIAPPDRDCGVD